MLDNVKGPSAIKLVCHHPMILLTILLYLMVTDDTSPPLTRQSSN